jgi:hypothetical protein
MYYYTGATVLTSRRWAHVRGSACSEASAAFCRPPEALQGLYTGLQRDGRFR